MLFQWSPPNLKYKTHKAHQISQFKCFSSRLVVVFAQTIEANCSIENADVVGTAPTGDSPTTYEWSTILLSFLLILHIITPHLGLKNDKTGRQR